mmetsp:Transcript_34896/g.86617  ORF Transcript_34896/g.86617 Transcript_34896/m.86617 type:complete len:217 (+) Transcript_34896:110-760(+)
MRIFSLSVCFPSSFVLCSLFLLETNVLSPASHSPYRFGSLSLSLSHTHVRPFCHQSPCLFVCLAGWLVLRPSSPSFGRNSDAHTSGTDSFISFCLSVRVLARSFRPVSPAVASHSFAVRAVRLPLVDLDGRREPRQTLQMRNTAFHSKRPIVARALHVWVSEWDGWERGGYRGDVRTNQPTNALEYGYLRPCIPTDQGGGMGHTRHTHDCSRRRRP